MGQQGRSSIVFQRLWNEEGKPALFLSFIPKHITHPPSDDDNVESCLLFPTESTMNED